MPLIYRETDAAALLPCSNYRSPEFDYEGRNCARKVSKDEGIRYYPGKAGVENWFTLEDESEYNALFNLYCSRACYDYDREEYQKFNFF